MCFSDFVGIVRAWGPVFGPTLALLAFFLWKDWRREDHLQARIEKLEQQQKDVILPMCEKCVAVIAANTAVLERLQAIMDRSVSPPL
jgi:hypothetical protein